MMSNCGRFALFPAVFGCSSDGYQEYIERKILECPELFEWSIVKYSHSGVHSKFFFFFPASNVLVISRDLATGRGSRFEKCRRLRILLSARMQYECVVKARGPLVHSPTHTCLSIMRHLH
jgi:hypothetical protein